MKRGPALLSSTQRGDEGTGCRGTDAFWDYLAAVGKRDRGEGRTEERESAAW